MGEFIFVSSMTLGGCIVAHGFFSLLNSLVKYLSNTSNSKSDNEHISYLDDLSSGEDELIAARFRSSIKSPPETHPIVEPFRRALILVGREWGMTAEIKHNVYNYSDTEKHTVHVTFECENTKIFSK